MTERPEPEHYGEERAEREMAQAERIVREEPKRRRWRAADLRTPPERDAEKLRSAARLRAETTMTAGWIAERSGPSSRGHLNHLLYRRKKSRPK